MSGPQRGWFLFGLAFLVLLSAWIWPQIRTRKIQHAVSQVRVADEQQRVIEAAGKPWRTEACGSLSGGQPIGCTKELVYAHPYAPYVPEYWVVYVDSERHVLSKTHLISP